MFPPMGPTDPKTRQVIAEKVATPVDKVVKKTTELAKEAVQKAQHHQQEGKTTTTANASSETKLTTDCRANDAPST